jgi:hypothetical protein
MNSIRLFNTYFILSKALKNKYHRDLGYKFDTKHSLGVYDRKLDLDVAAAQNIECIGNDWDSKSGDNEIRVTNMGHDQVQKHAKPVLEAELGKDALEDLNKILEDYGSKSQQELRDAVRLEYVALKA